MNHPLRTLSFFFALAFAGCFSGEPVPDPCAETRRCVAADDVGCCAGGVREVSVCQDSCPAGMIEQADCRMAGCGMGCETPLTCRLEYGDGCCGEAVFTTSCDACPSGSVEATECTMDYPTECNCGGFIRGFRPADQEAVVARLDCFEDLGGGCCGSFVGVSECGECPTGTLSDYACDMMSGDRIAPPEVTCRQDLGGGCCGDEIAPNACSAECPAGSINTASCAEVSPDADAAFPEPPMCFMLTEEGCCGEPVAASACGGCPDGSATSCDACEG